MHGLDIVTIDKQAINLGQASKSKDYDLKHMAKGTSQKSKICLNNTYPRDLTHNHSIKHDSYRGPTTGTCTDIIQNNYCTYLMNLVKVM